VYKINSRMGPQAIRMYLTGQERRLEKLPFQIVCISFEEF